MLLHFRAAFCVVCFMLGSGFFMAQVATAVFRITDLKNDPIAFATVVVYPMPDTVHKQQGITDSLGSISFTLAISQPYLVRVTAVGFRPFEKAILLKEAKTVFVFSLADISKTLNNVVVNSTRPLMRQEDDKTIVD